MEALRFNKTMLLMVIMMAMMWNMAKCELHNVGGSKYGWVPIGNLTKWSLSEHFYVGEWLYFGYDRHSFNVLEVNKTSYENCIETGFITNVTGGAGRDVFELKEAKTYYFLSGGGYCWQGVKVAVHVTEYVAPAPAPTHNGASALDSIQIYQSFLVFILILMFTSLLV